MYYIHGQAMLAEKRERFAMRNPLATDHLCSLTCHQHLMLQHGFHQGVVWDFWEIPPSISKSSDEKISATRLSPIEKSR
jgi:hypothetical protein